ARDRPVLPPFPTRRSSDLSQTARITAVWPAVAAPLAAFGLLALARWLLERVPAVGRAGVRLGRRVVQATTDRRPQLAGVAALVRSEEHTSELQSRENLVCR